MSRLAAALLLALALVSCKEATEPRAVQPPVMEGERVRFAADSPQRAVLHSEPITEEHSETMRLPARIVWDETRTVRIVAPLAGRIERLLVQPGEPINAGAALAVMASPELGQAQADAHRAEADFGLAEKNLARATDLHEHGIVAQKEVQIAQAERDRAAAERSRTEQRLKLYGGSGKVDQQFTLRSPISGVVVERNANAGQEVRPDQAAPGTPALFVVSDPTHLWVQVDAPESALGALRRGKVLRLTSAALGDKPLQARIELVSDAFDPQSRTVRVRASVDNHERTLKAEMFVTVELDVDQGKFMRVPSTAVLLRGETQYVFVDEGDGSYRRQQVRAEETSLGNMRVRSGLNPSERVVTEGGLLLMQLFGSARK
jgi:cobalt-zinc-cadmium efflux system membrane fusion protein